MKLPRIILAIPLMDEWEQLPFLLDDIKNQTYTDFEAVICVNQPEQWRAESGKLQICRNNEATLDYLTGFNEFPIKLIDRSSPGRGWSGKNYGVGWARKTVMDAASSGAGKDHIIISLDGDTRFEASYFQSVAENLSTHPLAVALAVPYYHPLTGNIAVDRSILRYEIYMRYYSLNLWRIASPYSFTALGSAMAFPVKSYRAIRGMTPNKSGEDFYFLQKLRKFGNILYWNETKVYPASRFSDRVFFGTGPAMIKGNEGDWSSYPIYPAGLFDDIAALYSCFPLLFTAGIATPLDEFLQSVFKEPDPWKPIRSNHPSPERFIRACHEKIDGLRILQYLKAKNPDGNDKDEQHLGEYIRKNIDEASWPVAIREGNLNFSSATVNELDEIRNLLAEKEEQYQVEHYQEFPI